ncbi:glutamate 5-kinase, partial [Candidatus Bathyarchaeota archaeon]|nr:glutamate 5-kinase [Candidatus Bathyarchaeota archaeon]
DLKEMEKLVSQITEAVKKKFRIVLVTSGAVSSGIAELGVRFNPNDIIFKQTCAAVGQSILMSHYRELFKKRGLKVAQLLLTKEDLSNRASYVHMCNVLDRLLQLDVVPIVNENDATSIDELKPISKGYEVNFSDNDILSVLIANAIQADLVVLLSNVDGLYTCNPKSPEAKLISVVDCVTPELKLSAEGKSPLGRGGMKTKLQAAEIATHGGIPVIIANSFREGVLLDILSGKAVGTLFKPVDKLSGKKKWVAYGASMKGQIVVNEGAKKAIINGASLLPIGISEILGQFDVGDVVGLVDTKKQKFGRGMVNYSSEEITVIKGMDTAQVSTVLGYTGQKEVITRKYIHLVEEEKE